MGLDQFDNPNNPEQPQPGPSAPSPSSESMYDAVSGFYRNALGRDPESAAAVNGWISADNNDLGKIQQDIYASPEAQAYSQRRTAQSSAPAASSAPSGGGGGTPSNGNDPGLQAYIASWAQSHPGANPSVTNDPGYWASRISQTHGSGPIDWGYWQGRFMTPEGAPEASGGASGGGPAPNQGSGSTFGDPAYQALNALAQARIASLQRQQSFPQLDALMAQLQQQQAVNKQRAADLAGKWGQRVTQLQQPLLTDANVVQQRALAENNLLASRDAALANAKASQSARGFAPTSGLAADQARQINENASNQQAQIEARLQQGNISADESRRNEATQLQGLITQALNGGDATALQEQAQQADLENQLYQTDQQRQTQQLAAAQIPVDLTNTGFQNANSSISNPNSALASLMPLLQASLTGQNNAFNQSNSQASGLSQIIQTLLGSLN